MSGSSSHGGARLGAGRKRKFKSGGVAVAVTVPEEHKEQLQVAIELVDEMLAMGFTIEQIRELMMKALQK